MNGMHRAYLALGSNLGDRDAAIDGAMDALVNTPGIDVVQMSAVITTDPVGGPPGQSSYRNAVVEIATTLDPHRLLAQCHAIEDAFGRIRDDELRWGPRTLDIDLLLYDDLVLDDHRLQLPHPRLHERPFVLGPLLEIAPNLVHPQTGLTIRAMHAALPCAAIAD
jgi:2-amino-4-hydroxy-6-hydroxymethyldihydropteridine diphosphokinase